MNSCVVVTLGLPTPNHALDLELSQEIELQHLVPLLVQVLNLPSIDGMDRPIIYQLFDNKRRHMLRIDTTLAKAGIATGDVLSLVGQVVPVQPMQRAMTGGATGLVRCPSGWIFALDSFGKDRVRVGRRDQQTGRSPDIDLSKELYGSTVSRSHAVFRRHGDSWELIPVTAHNITRVNATPLEHGKSRLLNSRDVVTLGGVTLFYEQGRLP